MSRLGQQQRAVLALLKNRPCESGDDGWLIRIAQSKELVLLREIARWWRQYQVMGQCRFTAALLKRTRQFESAVNHHFETSATSPYMEEMARGFLKAFGGNADGLLQRVALTELGLIEPRQGLCVKVDWDRHPDQVFAALESGSEIPPHDDQYDFP